MKTLHGAKAGDCSTVLAHCDFSEPRRVSGRAPIARCLTALGSHRKRQSQRLTHVVNKLSRCPACRALEPPSCQRQCIYRSFEQLTKAT